MRHCLILIFALLVGCAEYEAPSEARLKFQSDTGNGASVLFRAFLSEDSPRDGHLSLALIQQQRPFQILPLTPSNAMVLARLPAGAYSVDVIDPRKIPDGAQSLTYSRLQNAALVLQDGDFVDLGNLRIDFRQDDKSFEVALLQKHADATGVAPFASSVTGRLVERDLQCYFCASTR